MGMPVVCQDVFSTSRWCRIVSQHCDVGKFSQICSFKDVSMVRTTARDHRMIIASKTKSAITIVVASIEAWVLNRKLQSIGLMSLSTKECV